MSFRRKSKSIASNTRTAAANYAASSSCPWLTMITFPSLPLWVVLVLSIIAGAFVGFAMSALLASMTYQP